MRFLLDTNICIYIIKRKPQQVIEKFNTLQPSGKDSGSRLGQQRWLGCPTFRPRHALPCERTP